MSLRFSSYFLRYFLHILSILSISSVLIALFILFVLSILSTGHFIPFFFLLNSKFKVQQFGFQFWFLVLYFKLEFRGFRLSDIAIYDFFCLVTFPFSSFSIPHFWPTDLSVVSLVDLSPSTVQSFSVFPFINLLSFQTAPFHHLAVPVLRSPLLIFTICLLSLSPSLCILVLPYPWYWCCFASSPPYFRF